LHLHSITGEMQVQRGTLPQAWSRPATVMDGGLTVAQSAVLVQNIFVMCLLLAAVSSNVFVAFFKFYF